MEGMFFVIGPRLHVDSGIQASHVFDAYHRRIGDRVYRLVRHHHLMSQGAKGIQVYRVELHPGSDRVKSAVKVHSFGDEIPKRAW